MPNTKINSNTSANDVLPAMASFLSRHDKEAITDAPDNVQEMFNLLMETEHGDSREFRQRVLHTLLVVKDFGKAIAPFPQEVLWKATENI